jgi:hypothetical protein
VDVELSRRITFSIVHSDKDSIFPGTRPREGEIAVVIDYVHDAKRISRRVGFDQFVRKGPIDCIDAIGRDSL